MMKGSKKKTSRLTNNKNQNLKLKHQETEQFK